MPTVVTAADVAAIPDAAESFQPEVAAANTALENLAVAKADVTRLEADLAAARQRVADAQNTFHQAAAALATGFNKARGV